MNQKGRSPKAAVNQMQTMNNETTMTAGSQALAKAKSIDQVAAGAMSLFEQAGSFEAELQLAEAMGQMRALLTPDVMQPIMALMNTDLGFRTDKDPKVKQSDGSYPTQYSVDVVREVFIEAKLRGFHTAGNEFNIIAGRFYGAKAGFRRKVTRFPGMSQFKDVYEVPRIVADKGAIVKARASWVLQGVADSIEIEIPVKVNSFMGSDAILGKAERKLLKRVHDRITGHSTPDGEVGEEVNVTPDAGPKVTIVTPPKPKSESVVVGGTAAPVHIDASQAVKRFIETLEGSLSEPTPQAKLQHDLESAGVSFEDFRSWLVQTGTDRNGDSYPSWADVPTATVNVVYELGLKGVPKIITIFGKKGGAK